MSDKTGIKPVFDPTVQRLSGFTTHGDMPIDVPFMTEIVPGLWQGGVRNGLILPGFIRHVVSLYQGEAYRVKHKPDSTLSVRMLDAEDEDLGVVDEIARWAHARWKTGPLLAHCQAGLNRSSLVTARVLMLDGMTAAGAIALLREKRSLACLCNPAFEEWLRTLDDHSRHERDDTGEFPFGWTCLDCSGPEDQAPRVRWTVRENETTGVA